MARQDGSTGARGTLSVESRFALGQPDSPGQAGRNDCAWITPLGVRFATRQFVSFTGKGALGDDAFALRRRGIKLVY